MVSMCSGRPGALSNVMPMLDAWVCGSFGENGCCCVSVGVEFFLWWCAFGERRFPSGYHVLRAQSISPPLKSLQLASGRETRCCSVRCEISLIRCCRYISHASSETETTTWATVTKARQKRYNLLVGQRMKVISRDTEAVAP